MWQTATHHWVGEVTARTVPSMLVDWLARLMPTGAVRAFRGLLAPERTGLAGNVPHTPYQRCVRMCGALATLGRMRSICEPERSARKLASINVHRSIVCAVDHTSTPEGGGVGGVDRVPLPYARFSTRWMAARLTPYCFANTPRDTPWARLAITACCCATVRADGRPSAFPSALARDRPA